MNQPLLVITLDSEIVDTRKLDKHIITIGRNTDNDLVIMDPLVSKYHAVIESTESNEGQIVIRDLQSSNSTFVNNMKITAAYLNIGDEIIIGKHVLRLQYGKDKELSIDRSIKSSKDVSIPHEDTFVLDDDIRDIILKKSRNL